MDDDNAPKATAGMDYAHLHLSNLHFAARDIRYSADTISGQITNGAFAERSGFTLQQLKTTFQYTNQGAYLKDLLVQTPGTKLERNIEVSYPSLDVLQKNISLLKLNMDIQNSQVQVKDILSFVPDLRTQPAFSNPQATWYINSKVKGSVNDLRIASFRLKGMQQTNIELSGYIKGLPDMKNWKPTWPLKILAAAPKTCAHSCRPAPCPTISPSLLNSTCRAASTEPKNLAADLLLNTTLGTATVKGTVQNPADSNNIGYDAVVTTQSFDLKQLLQQPDLGLLTMNVTVKGKGRVPKTMNATVDGHIAQAQYKGYTYRDFRMNGQIAQQQFKLNAAIQNEPIHFTLDASGNLASTWPSIKMHVVIDSINTQALHLTDDPILYRGKIDADFPSTHIDSLQGHLLVTRNLLVLGERRIETDTLEVFADLNDSGQVIRVNSEVLTAQLWGQYHLTELGTVMQRSLQKYFSNAPDSLTSLPPYDFWVKATLVNKPLLQVLAPDLKRMDPVILDGHFTSNGGINASLQAPWW
ncbi:hypothetical protein [Paraflavitalea speifideaquila]|uniref:hypothetical protein n=1 Tax=Paraflavitalea speifideaquila TaxID=3076558 RepID=UPI0028E3B1CE|nr:hypothetical protein [Paraflavitalea speifideiaquila]